MSEQTPEEGATDQRTREEIERDLAETREHLAETVGAIGEKLDVKTRGQEAVTRVKDEHGTELAVGAGVLAVLVVGLIVWRRRSR